MLSQGGPTNWPGHFGNLNPPARFRHAHQLLECHRPHLLREADKMHALKDKVNCVVLKGKAFQRVDFDEGKIRRGISDKTSKGIGNIGADEGGIGKCLSQFLVTSLSVKSICVS